MKKTHTSSPATGHKRARSASLATLSEHLGLSQAAISRVLNGVPAAQSIPKATQDRIFAAAKLFNYRPNALARSLRHGRSMMIGVLVPEVSEGFATLVLAGIEQALLQAGYIFFLISHHHRPELIERALVMLQERSVDGMIAIDTILPAPVQLHSVSISCRNEQESVMSILLNHRRAAELAINHLAGLGHREIAVIRGQAFSSDSQPRWEAIRHAVTRAGLRLDPKLVVQLEGDVPTHEPGYFAAQRLLSANQKFTAVFAFNDVSAIGAIHAFREGGLRVPQDVSVVGFDDVLSAAYQNPALTTVRQPLTKMGVLGAEALVRSIEDNETQTVSKHLVVDPELIVRESTCPPPVQVAKRRGATSR